VPPLFAGAEPRGVPCSGVDAPPPATLHRARPRSAVRYYAARLSPLRDLRLLSCSLPRSRNAVQTLDLELVHMALGGGVSGRPAPQGASQEVGVAPTSAPFGCCWPSLICCVYAPEVFSVRWRNHLPLVALAASGGQRWLAWPWLAQPLWRRGRRRTRSWWLLRGIRAAPQQPLMLWQQGSTRQAGESRAFPTCRESPAGRLPLRQHGTGGDATGSPRSHCGVDTWAAHPAWPTGSAAKAAAAAGRRSPW